MKDSVQSSAEDGGNPSSSRKGEDKEGFSITHFPHLTENLKIKKKIKNHSCSKLELSGHVTILSTSVLKVEERRSR